MGAETGVASPLLGLIGPVFPYRGGIAQHTTLLHRTLRARGGVTTVSFRRQYPDWLFPGRSQLEPLSSGSLEEGVRYLLDPLNPYTWLQTARHLEGAGVRAVVLPWWTSFWAPCFGFLAGRFERQGREVVVLCHNAYEHETGRWRSTVARRFLRARRRFLAHTPGDAAALRLLAPAAEIAIHPHPVYDHFPDGRGVLPHRGGLELLFFGFVRPYKGLDVLAEALDLLAGTEVHLTVAGEWWLKGREARELRACLGRAANVEVLDSYLSAEDAAELFLRADALVLPYRRATGSGVLPLAYRYGKPVIAARIPGLEEVVEDYVTGRLFPPGDAAALAAVIREFTVGRPVEPARIRAAADTMQWANLADALCNLARGGTEASARTAAATTVPAGGRQ